MRALSRSHVPECRLVLAAWLCLALLPPAHPAPPPSAPRHTITARSPEAARSYDEGLRAYHRGQLDIAADDFNAASRLDERCGMAWIGLARVRHRQGRTEAARAALGRAREVAADLDDREQKVVEAWGAILAAPPRPAPERDKMLDAARRALNLALILYPDDSELWSCRGEVETNRLRAVPYYLAARRLNPAYAPEGTLGPYWDLTAP